MSKEKTLIYVSRLRSDAMRRLANGGLKTAKFCADLLSSEHLTVSADTLKECANMKERIQRVNIETEASETGHWQYQKEIVTFDNAPILNAEVDALIKKQTAGIIIHENKDELEEKLILRYRQLFRQFIKLWEKYNLLVEEMKPMDDLLAIDSEGNIILDGLDEYCAEAGAVYCESEQAEEMMRRHKAAAKAINDMFCVKGCRSNIQPNDLNQLFEYEPACNKYLITDIDYNRAF